MIDQILAKEKQNFDANLPVVLRILSILAPTGMLFKVTNTTARNFEVPRKDIVS